MTRLSLLDKCGPELDKKLPICRMCCKLFVSAETSSSSSSEDKRLAAFSPCGHIFHYACILDRLERMEDNCNCVTCFAKMEDHMPIILYMEWSKNARPVSKEEVEEVHCLTAPDDDSLKLREQLGITRLRLNSLMEQKEQLLSKLSSVNESILVSRSTYEALDQICQKITDRIDSTNEGIKKETRACDELSNRILRDKNKAIVGELVQRIQQHETDSQLCDFFVKEVAKAGDPDDLLLVFGALCETYKKRVKSEMKSLTQARTLALSRKKEIAEHELQIIQIERHNRIKKLNPPPSKSATATTRSGGPNSTATVVDRKALLPRPQVMQSSEYLDDDLNQPRKKHFTNFFN